MKTPLELPYPFPRHPSPPNQRTIAIYAAYPHTADNLPPNSFRRVTVQVFTQPYAAWHYANLFGINHHNGATLSQRFLDDNTLIIPQTDVRVFTRPYGPKSPTLRSLLNYTPTPTELAYRLPPHIMRQPYLLIQPFTPTKTINPDDFQPPLDLPPSTRTRTGSRPLRTTLKQSGLIHVSVIALNLNITPREARQALRDSKTPKPKGGWWFPPADLTKYTDIIKQHLKTSS